MVRGAGKFVRELFIVFKGKGVIFAFLVKNMRNEVRKGKNFQRESYIVNRLICKNNLRDNCRTTVSGWRSFHNGQV